VGGKISMKKTLEKRKMKIDILLVEDESDWISIITGYIGMCERLRLVGCTKEEDQMLSLIQKHNVDIVLLDLCL